MDLSKRVLNTGDPVVYFDEQRQAHAALVTAWHGLREGETLETYRERFKCADAIPSINLVFVVSQTDKTDPYGRQIDRRSSCSHGSRQSPPNIGNYFLFPEETR